MSVTWRGVQLDERTAAQMTEVAAAVPFYVDPSQGSWSGAAASAGTHSGCGAIDITNLGASECDALVYEMRRVGFAAWHRTPEQSDWVRHVHGISVQPGGKGDRGCLHASAHDQVVDYYENRNGLASNNRDDGPRDFVGVTWESYLRDKEPEPEPEPEPIDEGEEMFAIVAPDGSAYLIMGATRAHGIMDGSDLLQMEQDGIPVTHLTWGTFNSILAGRN